MMILFPSFVLKADTSVDCLVSYIPIGRAIKNDSLAYAEPRARNVATLEKHLVVNIISDEDSVNVNPIEPPIQAPTIVANDPPLPQPVEKAKKPKQEYLPTPLVLPAKLLEILHPSDHKPPLLYFARVIFLACQTPGPPSQT